MYTGKADEMYVKTRIRLYDQQPVKSKTTLTLPPDIDSCTQHILRCHLRVYIWTNCYMKNIPYISPYANGWKLSKCKEVIPVWFTGHQFPPSVSRSKPTHRKTPENNDAYDADDSDADIGKNSEGPKKGKSKKNSHETNSDGTRPGRKFRKNRMNMIVRGGG